MMQAQRFGWLYHQKARYILFMALGLFIFDQLLTHDGAIYSAIERGDTDINSLKDLYFKDWNHMQDTQIGQALWVGIFVLIGYAIAIRLAQRHYEKHGISI